jgi:hypothetical protein
MSDGKSGESELRYQLANVTSGFVIIEEEMRTRATRAYFSAESVPPKESYLEGSREWHFAEAAQSFQFSVRDNLTGEVTRFDELLGLLYYGCLDPQSTIHRIGDIAHEMGISLYVAIAYESPKGGPLDLPPAKMTMLNRAFNDRLRTRGKKVLIVPDLFGLHAQVSHGQLMLDFGLTDLPTAGSAGAVPTAKEKTR